MVQVSLKNAIVEEYCKILEYQSSFPSMEIYSLDSVDSTELWEKQKKIQ